MDDASQKGRAGKKLDAETVRTIRERYAAGDKTKLLSDLFSISQVMVQKLIRGEFWPHAGGPIQPLKKQIGQFHWNYQGGEP